MAAKNNRNKQQNNSQWGQDASFADVKLNASEKDAYLAWVKKSDANSLDALERLVMDSYRVSTKYDYNNMCVVVSLTQQDNKHVNSGLVIMSRAADVDDALLLSAYKVFVLFEGQRLPTKSEDDSWG